MRALLPFLLLAGCNEDDKPPPKGEWQIGPVINGKNYSVNCPKSFTGSFQIGPCEPHYVTKPTGSLTGKAEIRIRYRIEGKLHGAGCDSPTAIVPYFQRRGDTWQGEPYRFWSHNRGPATEGEHEIVAPLTGKWRTVFTEGTQAEFSVGLANAEHVGFTFANCTGSGHGAAGSGRFTLISFTII